jgi:hypothetical protein
MIAGPTPITMPTAARYVILLLLIACSRTQPWIAQELERAGPAYRAQRLLTPSTTPRLGCQLELVEGAEYGLCGYINRFGLPPIHDPISIHIASDLDSQIVTATPLEGGQRLLPREAVIYLLELLQAGHAVTLQLPAAGAIQLLPAEFKQVSSSLNLANHCDIR